jgi:hypothetical protein
MSRKDFVPGSKEESSGHTMALDFLTFFLSDRGDWNTQKFLDVIGTIGSYSLIEFDERNDTYAIHPLVHEWMQKSIPDSIMTSECTQYILGMAIHSSMDEQQSEGRMFRRLLLPHINEVVQDPITNLDVAVQVGWVYHESGLWKNAEKVYLHIYEITSSKFDKDDLNILASIANLATIYWNQGRWKEAEDLQVEVIEKRKQMLGVDHPDTLASMANLASTYWSRADRRKLGIWMWR